MFDVSAILVNYNTCHLLQEALDALNRSAHGLTIQVLIVDNASRDGSAAWIKAHLPELALIENTINVGFGRANNQALPHLDGRYVLLLNTDAFVSPETLSKSLAYLDRHPRCGILGVRLVGRQGESQPSARYFPTPWKLFLQRAGLSRFFRRSAPIDEMAWDFASERKCDWVPGCYYLVRREVIDQVGFFDPRYFLYYEEVDHCFAAKRAGWEVTCIPDTSVVHIGGESAKSDGELTRGGRQLEALQVESEHLYFRKNHGLWACLLNLWLLTLAEAIMLCKDVLKRRWPFHLSQRGRYLHLVWSSFFKTRFGQRSTR